MVPFMRGCVYCSRIAPSTLSTGAYTMEKDLCSFFVTVNAINNPFVTVDKRLTLGPKESLSHLDKESLRLRFSHLCWEYTRTEVVL